MMLKIAVRIAGSIALVTALAACHPPRDVRPPYHEPSAAKAAASPEHAAPAGQRAQ